MANTAIENNVRCSLADSTMGAFLTLAGRTARRGLVTLTALLVAITCVAATSVAQDPSEPPSAPEPQATPSQPTTVTVPAGTRFALVLTHPISSQRMHRGDDIHAQTTAPITVGDQVIIPAGTFVQGTVDRLTRNGSRGEFLLQSAAVIFPDGYVAHVTGPITIESDEGTAWLNPSGGAKAGAVIAPMAGLGIGAAIGSAAHTTQSSTLGGNTITSSTPKGLAIGSLVGLAVGGAVALVLLAHSHQFYVEAGSPMQMTLPQPVTLTQGQVSDSLREAMARPVAVPMPAPRPIPVAFPATVNRGTCFTAGTPGTPSTTIPGAPGPNGIPGPPTIIPGIPATPGVPYPCP